jgi:hypothetical protein
LTVGQVEWGDKRGLQEEGPLTMTTYPIGRDRREGAGRLGRRLAVSVLALLPVAVVLAVVLAGCGPAQTSGDGVASGGSPTRPAASSSESPAADAGARALQFANCLRAHGLDVQDPGPDGRPRLGTNVDPGKLQTALNACRQYAPDVMASGSLTQEDRERMLAYIQCLREHGIAIADPDPKTGMPRQEDAAKFRQPDAAMKKAQQACVDKQPNFLGGH